MTSKKARKDADNLAAVLEKIPQMFKEQTAIGQRLHEIIMAANPGLKPRLWYGMPGYAKSRSGPVFVFIRMDDYVTFGLTEKAHFASADDAPDKLIANAWFLAGPELDEATEARIADIVRMATS
ncbi:MAG: DUF1801 domain-containing protein [Chloroflexota bacterium]|nr:DUF1801 domain-containing protein [Chloroflexota bacterium]MDE2949901.1 DUF1801 domain-containing protein [Chloroflexota bacterium]